MYALCLISLGTGLVLGNWIRSWFWCTLGGIALICAGMAMGRRRL